MRVLLVEDDGFVRELLGDAMRDAGLSFVEARDGTAALDMLGQYPGQFDALVADLQLPGGVDGAAVAAAMRAQHATAPIVLVSGNATALSHPAVRDVHTLTKPFRLGELVALVRASPT